MSGIDSLCHCGWARSRDRQCENFVCLRADGTEIRGPCMVRFPLSVESRQRSDERSGHATPKAGVGCFGPADLRGDQQAERLFKSRMSLVVSGRQQEPGATVVRHEALWQPNQGETLSRQAACCWIAVIVSPDTETPRPFGSSYRFSREGGGCQGAQSRECAPMIPRSFALACLRGRREAFLNPRFPEWRFARDHLGGLVAVEVEV